GRDTEPTGRGGQFTCRHSADQVRASIELAPLRIERFFRDIERRVSKPVTKRHQRCLSVVVDSDERARALYTARGCDRARDELHRNLKHLGVENAPDLDAEEL